MFHYCWSQTFSSGCDLLRVVDQPTMIAPMMDSLPVKITGSESRCWKWLCYRKYANMSSSIMVTIIKWVMYPIGIFFIYALFSFMYLQQNYTRNMPQIEQIESGRIVPIKVNYNKIVYVSDLEKKKLDMRLYIFVLSGLLVFLLMCARYYFNRRFRLPGVGPH